MTGGRDADGDAEFPPGFRAWSGYPELEGPLMPPVQAVADFIVIGLRWSEASLRAALPPGLVPVPGNIGTAYAFLSDRPGPMSPFSYCFLGIEIEGFDSPDGSKAQYIVEGHISPRGGRLLSDVLNGNVRPGWARHDHADGVITGTGGPPGKVALRLAIRPGQPVRVDAHGIHNFLGPDPKGRGINVYPVAFTGTLESAEPLAVDILPGAGAAMRGMEPVELLWGMWTRNLSITYGAAQLIHQTAELSAESLRTLLLETFAQLGRPAIILGAGGRVVHLNRQAGMLGESGAFHAGRRLRLHRPDDQARLALRLAEALSTGADIDPAPFAAERPDGLPLVVQVMPLRGFLAGEPTALVLVTDPAAPPGAPPARALQLLGLTPAEARIAALTGAGAAPRMVADQLGLTLNTVRSALKIVYGKLGIARQSQLATLVARLG